MAEIIDQGEQGVFLNIHAVPGSKRTGIIGIHGEALKVALQAVAEKGRANKELIEVLAKAFSVARSKLRLTSGLSSRRKRVLIVGQTLEACKSKLEKLNLI